MSKQSKRRIAAKMIQAGESETSGLLSLSGTLAIQAASEGDQKKGPRRFSMNAYGGGELVVGNYPLPIVVALDGMTARSKQTPIYFGHHDGSDGSKLVGHADQQDKSTGRLILNGVVSAANQCAREVVEAADNGYEWQTSIGALPIRKHLQEVPAGKTVTVNGQQFTGPIFVARKSELRHVAILPEGADKNTSVSIAASAAHSQKEISMEFAQWIEALGFVAEDLTEKQEASLKSKYDAEVKAAAALPVVEGKAASAVEAPKFDLSACILAHQKHVANIEAKASSYVGKIEAGKLAEIQAACAQKAAELKAQALNEEKAAAWLEVQLIKAQADVEVALIRAERPVGPDIHGSRRDTEPASIEAGLCMAAGLRDLDKHFKPEVLEAGHRYNRSEGGSIQGLVLAAAFDNGYAGSHRIHRGNYDEVMQAAFIQASAPSTHALTTLLTTVGNKFLLQGFDSVEQVYREFAATRPVNDFKQITSYRMLDDMVFEEVGPAGEIKHGTASQESFTNQAKTYAKMFALTRQDIINDDLGAFDTIRNRIGRGSGIKLNQIFWAKFLDDAVFFNSTAESTAGGHNNLLTAVLGEAGLAAANVLLKSKTDGYGNPIDIGGQHILLTGATLAPTAKKWYVSQEIRDTTASTKTPTTNIYFNQYRPVESRYITDTSDWYLLPVGGTDMEPMEICYLDGVQAPTIESANADFNTLGVQFRGYFDFGVNQKEWRASIKSTGAG